MNSVATIEVFVRYKTVCFYTVKREDASSSEADDLFERMEQQPEYADQLEQYIAWLEDVGDHEEGALFEYFRDERICVALPPKRQYLDNAIDLRQYCHWVSPQVVILYNGGIKTTRTAQECPNVSRHFYNAQSWTKKLKEIGIETDGQNITNLDDLIINY